MKKVIVLKYGELSTKKGNINYFIKTLKNNIAASLKNIEHSINYDLGRMFIETDESNIDKIVEELKKIFGIFEIDVAYIDENMDFEVIKNNVLNFMKEKNFKTFKIKTKRSDKKYPLDSMEISKVVGAHILKNIKDIKVDVENPEVLFELEIRKTEVIYYIEKIKGLGGYPVGTLGSSLLMLSGGIDSPVAGYLAIKRGIKLEAIYFESPPHTSKQAKNKVINLCKELSNFNGSIKLHVINFTKIQESILKNIEHEYLITIMRRMMYRISERIANKNNLNALINGESIGQVASQTLSSMKAINEVIDLPVIRPVACFDKLEIIDIAKKINTYQISIEPFEDCCTIFVPDHPVINPVITKCREFELQIDYDALINTAIETEEVLIIDKNYKNNNYDEIL